MTDAGNGVFTDNSHGLVVGDETFAFNTAPNISSGSTDSALLNTKIYYVQVQTQTLLRLQKLEMQEHQ